MWNICKQMVLYHIFAKWCINTFLPVSCQGKGLEIQSRCHQTYFFIQIFHNVVLFINHIWDKSERMGYILNPCHNFFIFNTSVYPKWSLCRGQLQTCDLSYFLYKTNFRGKNYPKIHKVFGITKFATKQRK